MESDLRTEWQRRCLGLKVTHPKIQAAADACAKLASAIARNDALVPTLVLCGSPGCGKTHLAKRMAAWGRANAFAIHEKHWQFKRAPLSVSFFSWPEVCDGFKEGFYGVLRDLCEDTFVILDDIGADHDPSRNGADKLCQILSRRESKWTILTTNIAPEWWADKWDARIEDRLLRRSTVIDMSDVPSFATI
jgi:DNA replication protein DnaC